MNFHLKKKMFLSAAVFILIFLVFYIGETGNLFAETTETMGESEMGLDEITTSRECNHAILLAEKLLEETDFDLKEYKLISVENLIAKGNTYEGPQFWNLVFKKRSLIPETVDEIIGAGGEIFVKVDLNKQEAVITGYGE